MACKLIFITGDGYSYFASIALKLLLHSIAFLSKDIRDHANLDEQVRAMHEHFMPSQL